MPEDEWKRVSLSLSEKADNLLRTVARRKGDLSEALAHSNSKYQLGRSRTCKATENIPEIFENVICDQRAGLRETEGKCSKQWSRGQRVDRCDYHRILFPATRQSLIKSLPSVIHEPILFDSIFSSFTFSFVNST